MAQIDNARQVLKRFYNQGGPQSASDVLMIRSALEPALGFTDACILANAAGGVPIGSTLSPGDKRQSSEAACGVSGTALVVYNYKNAIQNLKRLDADAAFYAEQLGKGKSAQSKAALETQASEDADKVKAKAAEVAAVGAVAVGGAYALYLGAAALVAFTLAKASK